MDTLEQRIERLERSQRRYRVATMAVVLLAVASGFAKDSVPKVLRTQKLEIVTAKGVTVATLDKGLGGSLTLYDDEGKQRASLWAHSFGSMLSMQGLSLIHI